MSSAILELQKEISSQDCDVINVLRRAHLIATKLNLVDFDKWLMYELNGYPNNTLTPDYRRVKGELKANNPYYGWVPVILADPEMEKLICQIKLINSVSEIKSMCDDSDAGIFVSIPGSVQQSLAEMSNMPAPMQMVVKVPRTAVMDIIEKVKNAVLEWTLKLEKEGILGDEMSFNEEEKKSAQVIPQTINNYYAATNIISGTAHNMQVVAGDNATLTIGDEKIKAVLAEIERSILEEQMLEEDKDEAIEILREISEKVEQGKKVSVIKAALIGLKDFLINAGAGVAAALLHAKIQGLF